MRFKYSNKDKLKSKKQIDALFNKGSSIMAYPLLVKYKETSFDDDILIKTGVSVSKHIFKKAVDRNHVKRLLRETYRLNKPNYFNTLTTSHAVMILYIGKEKPQFSKMNNAMKIILNKLEKKISKH